MELHDTAGQEDYDNIRSFGYQGASVFLVCFAVNDATTFHNVRNKWMLEVQTNAPTAKVVLVGTKSDKRKKRTGTSLKRRKRQSGRGDEV